MQSMNASSTAAGVDVPARATSTATTQHQRHGSSYSSTEDFHEALLAAQKQGDEIHLSNEPHSPSYSLSSEEEEEEYATESPRLIARKDSSIAKEEMELEKKFKHSLLDKSHSFLHGSESEAAAGEEEEEGELAAPPRTVKFTNAQPLLSEQNPDHDDGTHLPYAPSFLFPTPPSIDSLEFTASTGAYHASHGNFILSLSFQGFSWKVRFHRQSLLELHSSLKSIQIQKAMGVYSLFNLCGRSSSNNRQDSESQARAFGSQKPNSFTLSASDLFPHKTSSSTQHFQQLRRFPSSGVNFSHYSRNNHSASTTAAAASGLKRLHFPRSLLYVQTTALDEAKRLKIAKDVTNYLGAILGNEWMRNLPAVCEFLRVSTLSFDATLGPSVMEGWAKVQKHINSRTTVLKWRSCRMGCLLCNCACLPLNYTKRTKLWVVIKQHCAIFVHKPLERADSPAHVLLFDSKGFDLRKGFSTTGRKKAFFLYSNAWIADFKFPSRMEMKAWASVLVHALQNEAGPNAWQNKEHANLSFAPVREDDCTARFLVDGKAYFTQVLHALRRAEREIFISGWWVTPDVELERTSEGRIKLSEVLMERAANGVRVHILMFSEVNFALALNSKFQESRLAHCANIFVQRHPTFNLLAKEKWYWSHHEKIVVCDGGQKAFVGGLDLCWGRYDTPHHLLVDDGVSWPGIDYYNPRIRDIEDPRQFSRCLLNRADETQVRMPWHDVSCELRGAVAKDVARHFIHQWNFALESRTGSAYGLPKLIPQEFPATAATEEEEKREFHRVRCQVLRSLPQWSGGGMDMDPESSIHNALLAAIAASQRYVYIENQFFVSGMDNDGLIANRIAQALYARISRAAAERAKFRVIFFLPLLPAFEGGDLSDASLRQVLYWQYRTICRGGGGNRRSLLEMLEDDANISDPHEYLTFFSLRTYQPTSTTGNLVSEMIYIHSKVMIIDDHVCFIGSANINDRSLLGSRDSEVCVQITDLEFESSAAEASERPNTLFGEPWALAGKFCKRLLRNLLGEHFNELTLANSAEVLDDFLLHFDVLLDIAQRNTRAFESVFHCIPSDSVRTFKELAGRLQPPPPQQQATTITPLLTTKKKGAPVQPPQPQQEEAAAEEDEEAAERTIGKLQRYKSFKSLDQFDSADFGSLNEIQGSAVLFPLDFLCDAKRVKPKSGVVITDIVFT